MGWIPPAEQADHAVLENKDDPDSVRPLVRALSNAQCYYTYLALKRLKLLDISGRLNAGRSGKVLDRSIPLGPSTPSVGIICDMSLGPLSASQIFAIKQAGKGFAKEGSHLRYKSPSMCPQRESVDGTTNMLSNRSWTELCGSPEAFFSPTPSSFSRILIAAEDDLRDSSAARGLLCERWWESFSGRIGEVCEAGSPVTGDAPSRLVLAPVSGLGMETVRLRGRGVLEKGTEVRGVFCVSCSDVSLSEHADDAWW